MPLMTTKPMFDLAYEGGFAVGAFNVNNMELAQSIIDACASEKSPLILQISKGARKQAKDFWEKTKIDSLAVAIGTSHGAYKFKAAAVLAFDRIEEIMKTCPGLPLVMHGSSSVPQEFVDLVNKFGGKMPNAKGVPEDRIAMSVLKYGVCTVNIVTDLRLAMTAKIREVFAT